MKDSQYEKIYDLIDNGEYEKAKKSITNILKKDEKDIDAQKLFALCEVNLENYDNARIFLENVIKYRQDEAICWYYLGCCYDALEMYTEAKHAYSKVIELRPEYVDAYKSLAILYIKILVFPEPALDKTNCCELQYITAFFCASLKSSKKDKS